MPSFESFMFWMVYTLCSLGIIIIAVAIIILRWRVRVVRRWPAAEGLVLTSKVEDGGNDAGWFPVVTYRYEVGGRVHESSQLSVGGGQSFGLKRAERIIAPFPVGSRVPVYYDPRAPANAVLMHGDRGLSRLLFIMIFALAGMIAIFYGVRLLASGNA